MIQQQRIAAGAPQLLRRHISSSGSLCTISGILHIPCDAEIAQHCLGGESQQAARPRTAKQNIGGFYVQVDHSPRMDVFQGGCYLEGDLHCLAHTQALMPLALKIIGQRTSTNVFHGEVVAWPGGESLPCDIHLFLPARQGVHTHHPWMIEATEEVGLVLEKVKAIGAGDLECYPRRRARRAIFVSQTGFVKHGHPALPTGQLTHNLEGTNPFAFCQLYHDAYSSTLSLAPP